MVAGLHVFTSLKVVLTQGQPQPGHKLPQCSVCACLSFVGGALAARGRHSEKADTENKGTVSSTKGKKKKKKKCWFSFCAASVKKKSCVV